MSSDGDGPISVRPRKSMQAWRVTAENIERVAAWCGGKVFDDGQGLREIMVDRPDDATVAEFAAPGDWVLDPDPIMGTAIVGEFEWFAKHYEITGRPDDAATEIREFTTTTGSYRLTRR